MQPIIVKKNLKFWQFVAALHYLTISEYNSDFNSHSIALYFNSVSQSNQNICKLTFNLLSELFFGTILTYCLIFLVYIFCLSASNFIAIDFEINFLLL